MRPYGPAHRDGAGRCRAIVASGDSKLLAIRLEVPKPMLRDAGRELAGTLPPNANVGVIVPGDQGNSPRCSSTMFGSPADFVLRAD